MVLRISGWIIGRISVPLLCSIGEEKNGCSRGVSVRALDGSWTRFPLYLLLMVKGKN